MRPDARARMVRVHRAALRALASLGPRKYKLVDVDRRPPSTGYIFLVTTPKKQLLYAYGRDDNGLVSGTAIIETVDYAHVNAQPLPSSRPSPAPLVQPK